MKTNRFLSLAAFFAMALTFSCSSDDPSPPPSVEPSSNSSGENQMVYCKLNAGTCSQMSLSTCMELVNAGAAQIVSNCNAEEPPPPPPPQSSSSNGVTIIGYCDYGPIQSNGDGGCFPMATADDEANCAKWGKVVSSCGAAPSSNSVPSSSSNISPPPPSSSSKPSSSSVIVTIGYCDYGPIQPNGDGGCFPMGTAEDQSNCALYGTVVSSCPSSSSTAQNTSCLNGTFTDTRDKKTYKCVKIGTQTWMAQNLDYCAKVPCYYVEGKRDTYGLFYASPDGNGSGLCPSGWHLPSLTEFTTLVDYAGGSSTAGTKLKAKSEWNNGNGTDNYNFTALPGGYLDSEKNVINKYGSDGYWWSSSTNSNYLAGTTFTFNIFLHISADKATATTEAPAGVGIDRDLRSVRCIQD